MGGFIFARLALLQRVRCQREQQDEAAEKESDFVTVGHDGYPVV
jgi:hypothetical protein